MSKNVTDMEESTRGRAGDFWQIFSVPARPGGWNSESTGEVYSSSAEAQEALDIMASESGFSVDYEECPELEPLFHLQLDVVRQRMKLPNPWWKYVFDHGDQILHRPGCEKYDDALSRFRSWVDEYQRGREKFLSFLHGGTD